MRLFIAIQIPDNIRAAFAELIQELREVSPRAKWVRAENLHVTLKFLGHTEPAELDAIKTALQAIRSTAAVQLQFRGLGFFPNEKRPRVFWAGMQSSDNLARLAVDIDQATHALGFPPDQRPFSPHLTLARFEPPGISCKLLQKIHAHTERSFGLQSAAEFQLIESKLKPTGAEYTTVQTVRFAPGG